MKSSSIKKLVLVNILLIAMLFISAAQSITPKQATALESRTILGKELFGDLISNSEKDEQHVLAEEEPIFWALNDGANISYNPIVLFVNIDYWDNLPFYDQSEEYVFEMYANESTIFDSSYPYSLYNEYFWDLGYDWNISQYSPGTYINLTVFFYEEDTPSLNHTASIGVTIQELKETPTIDMEDFTINLFHWPGSSYSYGLNPYYHYAIYPDGYIEFKYGERGLYYSDDLSGTEAKALMQELIDLGFFQFKDTYFAPEYDYRYDSDYQIYIESKSVQEWKAAYEAREYIIKPTQFEKCLDAIEDLMVQLNFAPIRWKWDLFFIITGSSLGGIGVLCGGFYLLTAAKRRR